MLKDAGNPIFDDFVKIVQAHPEIQNNYQDYGIPGYLADFLKKQINVEIPKDSNTKEDTTKKDEQTGTKDTKEPASVKTEYKNKVDDKKQQTQRKPNDTLVTEEQKRIEKELKNGKGNPDIYRSLGDTVPATKDEEKKQEEDTKDMKTHDGDKILSIFDWGDEFANIPEARTLSEISEASKNKETLAQAEKSTEQLLSQIESDVETKQIKKPGKLFTLLTKIKPLVSKMSSKVKEYFKNTVDVINKTLADAEVEHMKELSAQFRSAIHSYYEPKSIEEFNLASEWLSMLKSDLYAKMERVYYPEIQALKQKYGDVPTPSELDIYKRILYLGTETEAGKRFLNSLSVGKQYSKQDFDIAQSYITTLENLFNTYLDSTDFDNSLKQQEKKKFDIYLKNGLRTASPSDVEELMTILSLSARQYIPATLDEDEKHDCHVEDAIQQLVLFGFENDKMADIPEDAIKEAKNILSAEYAEILKDSEIADDLISAIKQYGLNDLNDMEKERIAQELDASNAPHLYKVFPQIDSVLSELEDFGAYTDKETGSGAEEKPSIPSEKTEVTEKTTDQPKQQENTEKVETDKKPDTKKEEKVQEAVETVKEETEETAKKLGYVDRLKNKEYHTKFGTLTVDDVLFDDHTIRDVQEKMLSLGNNLNFNTVRKNIKVIEYAAVLERGIKKFLDAPAEPDQNKNHTLTFTGKVVKYKAEKLINNFEFKCTISKTGSSAYDATAEVTGSPVGSEKVSVTGLPTASKALFAALYEANQVITHKNPNSTTTEKPVEPVNDTKKQENSNEESVKPDAGKASDGLHNK